MRIVAGSDAGVTDTPFDSLLDEVSIISDAGLGPVAALRSATTDSAEALGLDDRGEISEGRRADLVLLDGDPTRSVDALRRRRAVVSAGVVSR